MSVLYYSTTDRTACVDLSGLKNSENSFHLETSNESRLITCAGPHDNLCTFPPPRKSLLTYIYVVNMASETEGFVVYSHSLEQKAMMH